MTNQTNTVSDPAELEDARRALVCGVCPTCDAGDEYESKREDIGDGVFLERWECLACGAKFTIRWEAMKAVPGWKTSDGT